MIPQNPCGRTDFDHLPIVDLPLTGMPMCLIAFAYRVHPDYELILAANRDEFFHRPSTPAHHWATHPHIFAGRDEEQGGTWLGMDTFGRFTALTNYRQPDTNTYPRSRGHLTADYLVNSLSAQAYIKQLETQLQENPETYAGFNLLIKDREDFFYLSNRSDGKAKKLAPGLYGLSNHLLDTEWPKLRKVKSRLAELIKGSEWPNDESTVVWPAVRDTFRDPEKAEREQLPITGVPPDVELMLSSVFIEGAHYGTRATTFVTVNQRGQVCFYEQNYDPLGLAGRLVSETFKLNV